MSVAPSKNTRKQQPSDTAKAGRQFGEEAGDLDVVSPQPQRGVNELGINEAEFNAADVNERAVNALPADPSDHATQNAMLLLAKVAHEMRTPLSAIAGFAELLKSEKFGPLGDPKYREYADLILNGATYTLTLLDDLLDPEKVAAGGFLFAEEPVDLAELVAASVETLRPLAEKRDISFKLDCAASTRPVRANARALQQILFNLLSNAIRVSQPHSEVGVFIQAAEDGSIRLGVSDTGAGDSKVLLAKSRAPLDPAPFLEGLVDGHGLGLPLTRNIAEAMGADLHIKSAASHGTMIEICFPHDKLLAESIS